MYVQLIVQLWRLHVVRLFQWPHMVWLCHQLWHILGRLWHLVLWCIRLEMCLCFPVNPITCSYHITSLFLHKLVITAGSHHLVTLSWDITLCPTCRSCEGKTSCLSMFLITSGWIPSCFLAALDIGKSELALLPCRICIGNCKLPVRKVL